jgi:hypothetical protein
MKIGVQPNPQVSIDKPGASLMPTLIEQVRAADQSGFSRFSMGEHYNILVSSLHQVLRWRAVPRRKLRRARRSCCSVCAIRSRLQPSLQASM